MFKNYRELLIGTLLSLCVMALGILIIRYDLQSYTLLRLEQIHHQNQSYINEFKSNQTQTIRTLAKNRSITNYLNDKTPEAESLLETFLLADTKIMQIRLIDAQGNERIRFDRDVHGLIRHIPALQLQNKAERPYFKQFIALPENSVGFSEFDLNIEHGKVEIPFNPTLRIGVPIYNRGVKQGILVINYYMKDWLMHLQASNNAHFYLIDKEGYFLMHPDPLWSWSRYHSPSKKVMDYFQLSPAEFVQLQKGEKQWVDNAAAFTLDVCGSKLLALYESNISVNDLLVRRLAQFGIIIIISLLLIVVPLVRIIRHNLNEIEREKAKTKTIHLHQAKIEAMGDMIAALAHQWRQPLNSIGLLIQDLSIAHKHGELDQSYFESSQKQIMDQLLFMSQTINSFRNFFANEEHPIECNLVTIIDEIRSLYHAQLNTYHITLSVDESNPSHYDLTSYPSEIKQIILNLISNAKDAIIEHGSTPSTISIRLDHDEAHLYMRITDHAGGIDPVIGERIFEPYFTTKSQGTGLGLYIARTLAEYHLEGSLSVISDPSQQMTTFLLNLPRTLMKEKKD